MTTCRSHLIKKPILNPNQQCICQGLCLMREFRLKYGEKKCSFEELPGPSYKIEDFVTGSSYDGEWRAGCGMHGYGEYTFSNGVVYVGEFKDGAMNGEGELRYQTEAGQVVIQGQWKNDILIKRKLIFNGSTEYKERDWNYCKMPDRRFLVGYDAGLQPAGNSFLTTQKPPIPIPSGCYDVGDGIYDPAKKVVFNYDLSQCIRRPYVDEQKWIVENCRRGNDVSVGPRQDLYETFLQAATNPAPIPLPEARTETWVSGPKD